MGNISSSWQNGNLIFAPQTLYGEEFCVDANNGSDSNDGHSWDTPFATIAKAVTASNARKASSGYVRKLYDARNVIYIAGGAYTETLLVTPVKCDVIGVGSTDNYPKATIIGAQVFANPSDPCGVRFFNMRFQYVSADIIVHMNTSNHGAAFIGCDFLGSSSTTVGLQFTNCTDYRVENCRFIGADGGRMVAGIVVVGTTSYNGYIFNNHINAGIGITIPIGGGTGTLIANNLIKCTTLAIDENSDQALVANNRWVSDAVVASSYDLAVTACVGNIATGSDDTLWVPIPN